MFVLMLMMNVCVCVVDVVCVVVCGVLYVMDIDVFELLSDFELFCGGFVGVMGFLV